MIKTAFSLLIFVSSILSLITGFAYVFEGERIGAAAFMALGLALANSLPSKVKRPE